MTRARDDLTLIAPQRFYLHGQPKNGDRHVFASRTRFIPAPLLERFDRQSWPLVASEPAPSASEGPKADLAARMRAMWR
jgi:DNA helicase-2/ATP-dependent DNA helicase PcrA